MESEGGFHLCFNEILCLLWDEVVTILSKVTSFLCKFLGQGPALAVEWGEEAEHPLSYSQGLPLQVNELYSLQPRT